MPNHTKGEWELRELKSGMGMMIISGNKNIAKTSEGSTVKDLIEIIDNANLLVAAKDMYKALKAFEYAFKDDTVMAKGFATKMMIGEAIEKAKKAIAKSEGK
jgi:hypothetical protein